MAHPGYVAIGLEEPREVVNTDRAIAYANAAGGLPWLLECDACPDLAAVVVDGGEYGAPWSDPAPWFTPRIPDSAGFFGVIGLELAGAEDSTRTASVTTALRGGGVIGLTYNQPRTMTLRAMAVAEADCSLSYGLHWLAEQFMTSQDYCAGDPVSFFDCCPDARCDPTTDVPVGPCWPTTYAGLSAGPACDPDWWPATYDDLHRGPPYLRAESTGDWCDWVGVYHELSTWLPEWNCCHELNVIPRWKSMDNARITAGPTVLSRPSLSVGALAEIEFEITAGDPVARRMPFYWPETFSEAVTWTTRPASLSGDPCAAG